MIVCYVVQSCTIINIIIDKDDKVLHSHQISIDLTFLPVMHVCMLSVHGAELSLHVHKEEHPGVHTHKLLKPLPLCLRCTIP